MHRYSYEGPVREFNRCIESTWYGETEAVSEKKARSNLTYQWKRQHGRSPASKIILTGNIELVS